MSNDTTRSGAEIAELLRVAKLKLEREERRRTVEIVASGIVVQLVESIGQDPSLEALRDTVVGLLLDGRSPAEALVAIGGLAPVPEGRGPGQDLTAAILRGQEDISRRLAGLERSTADLHALLSGRSTGAPRRRQDQRDMATPLLDLEESGGVVEARGDAAGQVEPERRSDAGAERPRGRRGGPRCEGMTQQIRDVSARYMKEKGAPVTIAEVRDHLDALGVLEGADEHAVDDAFAKTYVRFGKELWLSAQEPFPERLPSLVGLMPRQRAYREHAERNAASWNRARPDGGATLALRERGTRKAQTGAASA